MSKWKKRDVLADYFDLFNNEVKTAMSLPQIADPELYSSKVHTKSFVKRLEPKENISDDFSDSDVSDSDSEDSDSSDDSDESSDAEKPLKADKGGRHYELGAYWSSYEKTVFFHCLSRYSIHRLDEWSVHLPGKSKFEIYGYYDVLKKNLQLLKTKSTGSPTRSLLRIMDFPISYEMDEWFVNLEEAMSERVRNEFEQPLKDQDDLINLSSWTARWGTIYSRSQIEEIQPTCKVALPWSQEAYNYVKECCYSYAKSLVYQTVLEDYEKRSIAVRENIPEDPDSINIKHQDSKDPQFRPHVITKDHVTTALISMKQKNKIAPTLAEVTLTTLAKYQLNYESTGKLFRTKEIANSMIPKLIAESINLVHNTQALPQRSPTPTSSSTTPPPPSLQITATIPYALQPNKTYRARASANSNSSIYNNNNNTNTKRRKLQDCYQHHFIQDDPLDRINNDQEQVLCDWETTQMEARDIEQSRQYQSILTNYLYKQSPYFHNNRARIAYSIKKDQNQEQEQDAQCPITTLSKAQITQFLSDNI